MTRSRISEAKFREVIRYFALDIETKKIAVLTGLSRPCVNRVRLRIAEHCEGESLFKQVKLKLMKVILELVELEVCVAEEHVVNVL